MGCKQVFCSRGALSSTGATTRYFFPATVSVVSGSASGFPAWPVTGTFKKLRVDLASAPPTGETVVYTLVKNGVDTSVTVTLTDADTSAQHTGTTVSVTAGDTVYVKRASSGTVSSTTEWFALEFDGAVAGESAYGGLEATLPSATATSAVALFTPVAWSTAQLPGKQSVVAAAGNLASIDYILLNAPGAGKQWVFTIYKNSVAQDGAGGTPDTRVTISDAATTGGWSGTLACAAGDLVQVQATPTGTPTLSPVAYGVKFVATVDGESQGGAAGSGLLVQSNGSVAYQTPLIASATSWTASGTESTVDLKPGISSFTIRDWYLKIRASTTGAAAGPGSGGDGWTFVLRQDNANPASGPSITVTDATTEGSDLTNEVTIASGNTSWSVQATTAVSPNQRIALWGFVQYALAESVGGGGGGSFAALSLAW
jgi:hypothetical protein